MLGVPPKLARLYDTRLEREGIAAEHRPHYKKWLRFYWDFCHQPGRVGMAHLTRLVVCHLA